MWSLQHVYNVRFEVRLWDVQEQMLTILHLLQYTSWRDWPAIIRRAWVTDEFFPIQEQPAPNSSSPRLDARCAPEVRECSDAALEGQESIRIVFSGLHRFINFGPSLRITRTLSAPNYSLSMPVDCSHHIVSSQMFVNPTFQLVFGVPWATSSASHTPIPPTDSESQLRIAMLHKPPLLRHISSVQRRSLFCLVICFLIAFGDELFEERHFLHRLHLAGAWECANDDEETALVTEYFCRAVSRDPTPGMDTLLLQCNANC